MHSPLLTSVQGFLAYRHDRSLNHSLCQSVELFGAPPGRGVQHGSPTYSSILATRVEQALHQRGVIPRNVLTPRRARSGVLLEVLKSLSFMPLLDASWKPHWQAPSVRTSHCNSMALRAALRAAFCSLRFSFCSAYRRARAPPVRGQRLCSDAPTDFRAGESERRSRALGRRW